MNIKTQQYLKETTIIISLFLIALIIRLYKLHTTLFDVDIVTEQMSHAERIMSGQIVLGNYQINGYHMPVAFGPMQYYVMAIAMLFSKNYLVWSAWTAILNSLAVIIVYLLCLKFFNRQTGIIAALFFATNPWAVFYSRYVWTPSYLPIFIVCTFFLLFTFLFGSKKMSNYALPFLFIFMGLVIQPYGPGVQVALICILALLLFKKINLKTIAVGSVCFLIPLIPFIVDSFIRGTNPIKNAFTVFSYYAITGSDGGGIMKTIVDALGIPVMFSTNYFGKYMYGTTHPFTGGAYFCFLVIAILLILLFLLSLLYFIKHIKKDKKFFVLSLWFFVPIILLIVKHGNVAPHYLISLLPVVYIILALFLNKVVNHFSKLKLVHFVYLFMGILLISQTTYSVQFYNFIDKYGRTDATYDSSYQEVYDAVDFILNDAGNNNFVLIEHVRSNNLEPYTWMFKYRGSNPTYINIQNISELEKINEGYFILDRYSMDNNYKYSELENKFLDELEIRKTTKWINHIAIIKLST